MDDLRLGAAGHVDWYAGNAKDEPKKRSRHPHAAAAEDPVDEVILSSEAEGDQSSEEDSASE